MKWKSHKIAAFCTTGSGGTPSRKKNEYYDGTIPWVKSGELRNEIIFETEESITELGLRESSAKIVPANSILVAMYGATVGKTAILGVNAATNQAICNIQPNPQIADYKFVRHYLNRNINELLHKRVGGAQPNISQQIIKNTKVPLPPISEQRRIVEILDQADRLRKLCAEADKKAKRILPALFIKMFGDPATNPTGWPEDKFGNVGTLDRGKSKHRPRNAPELLEGPHPLIQTGDVANSGGRIKKYTQTYSDIGLAQSKMWPKGTLCITIAANIAKTGVLEIDACFPDSIVGFHPGPVVTTEYIQSWLHLLQPVLESNAPQAAQKNINLQVLRALPLPLPPLLLQQKFSSMVMDYYRQAGNRVVQSDKLQILFN